MRQVNQLISLDALTPSRVQLKQRHDVPTHGMPRPALRIAPAAICAHLPAIG
jgi:hypothetical protein